MRFLIAALAAALLVAPALAQQGQPGLPPLPLPPDAQLDAALAAHDWKHLGAALLPVTQGDALAHAMDWMQERIDAGGGSFLGFLYARDLWNLGDTLKVEDPESDMRVTAVLVVLYTYELIAIDGAKCDDRTAPGHRMDQLLMNNGPALAFGKAEPAELKGRLVTLAVALEERTAPLRQDDDLLCRDGMAQMQAGIEAGVATPPGGVGKTVAVEAPPGWTPKLVAAATYAPLQETARAAMSGRLTALLQ